MRCQTCGKFPLCNRENNDGCNKWIRRDVELKLNKKDGDSFEFERINNETNKCR